MGRCNLFVMCFCASIVADHNIDDQTELDREFFLSNAVELESRNLPDLALRAFRTSLLLLDEETGLDSAQYLSAQKFIRTSILHTKARRLSAFMAISAVIYVGKAQNPLRMEWKIGFDILQVATKRYLTAISR